PRGASPLLGFTCAGGFLLVVVCGIVVSIGTGSTCRLGLARRLRLGCRLRLVGCAYRRPPLFSTFPAAHVFQRTLHLLVVAFILLGRHHGENQDRDHRGDKAPDPCRGPQREEIRTKKIYICNSVAAGCYCHPAEVAEQKKAKEYDGEYRWRAAL